MTTEESLREFPRGQGSPRPDGPAASNPPHVGESAAGRLLLIIGALWLLLGAGLLFYQFIRPATVEVSWETATEQNTAGFNLYRAADPNGDFVLINAAMIDSQGSPVSGATYSYVDDTVQAGETYYYLLEEIEHDATRHRYDEEMFAYEVPRVAWWIAALAAVSVVVGLVLIVSGLKEER